MTLPLESIVVLDFSNFLAGQLCGLLLASMGAEVMRIEKPGGEIDRSYGLLGPDGETITYKMLNLAASR